MVYRNSNGLKDHIRENEFSIAKQLIGLTDGKTSKDKECHQPCPCCGGHDRFWFNPKNRTFHCRQCDIGGDIFDLIGKVHSISFTEACGIIADHVGYGNATGCVQRQNTKQKGTKPAPQLSTSALEENCTVFKTAQAYRPEITFDTYHRVGAKLFRFGQGEGIAIPMFSCDGSQSGWVRYCTDGTKKNSLGSISGTVGTLARDALLSKRKVKIWFKTAGVSDCLILTQQIAEAGLDADYTTFTSGAGENEHPEKFGIILRPALTGQTVGVIQDNDETGARGAQRWAEHIAEYAADVRIVRLPEIIFDCPVKDLRDFFATDGTTLTDLLFQ